MVNRLNMDKALDKAEILIEALPYIRKFNRKVIVVKYGGSAMENEELKKKVMEDVVLLKLVGFKPIIVHGGGKEISRWCGRVGIESRFEGGLRVTDEETLEVAEMVLSKVNQELVTMIGSLGVLPAGVSGKDGGLLTAHRKMPEGRDIGFVGEIENVNTKILWDLLRADYLPVVYTIGSDEKGQAYNINADDAAYAIARAMGAEKLAFLTDADGVYEDGYDPDTLISELYVSTAKELIEAGKISGGMLPKIKNCISAIENGVKRVHILNGEIPHCLLLEIFTHRGVGTAILGDKEEKFYHD